MCLSVCPPQGGVCVCRASVCAWTAGRVIAAVVPSPQQPVNQPTACFAVGGADVCAAGACATTPNTLETSVRTVLRVKAAANHTGTCQLLLSHQMAWWESSQTICSCSWHQCLSVFKEVCGLPPGSRSDPKEGRTLQRHLCPIGGLHGWYIR